eukprot:Gregarina_sp_Pseudo_9__3681@NODE_382_length_2983_cov_18_573030_g361_i0_p1_GENE_NODE_382_length_2983_cov_18_573030_g361_i0NODE_382_length_2983_cov_18_573030_g361_i0_p1_ORF_typecomplete_len556_score83_01TauE/PF01925_19/5_2e20TauE/PF01925_19/2_7e20ABC_membrane/PF00664_23/0_0059ABC_membrane/PF00664_23/3_3e03FUSC_2/PF13515_6/6e03FUSC_2/PF13515_6/0_081FUSC_2/PF13515_6/4_8e03FUSC_2/PF13515_6/1_6e02FUSC_2/PF13515_6/5_7e02SIT/PF15330_6/2_5SIT/PF15330_6/3_7e02PIGY/PF15159_6/0_71PIGY/PF15159_6/3_8e03_NODE_
MLVAEGLQVSTWFFGGLASLCLGAGVLASLSGTGGGSLFIPIFSLAFPSDVHSAVPLAKMAVFGVSLGACIVNFSGFRGVQRTSSFINYELATLIQPATLIGCLFGVFLNLLLPSIAIVLALVCILSFVAYKTFRASSKQRQEAEALTSPPLSVLERATPSTGDGVSVYIETIPSGAPLPVSLYPSPKSKSVQFASVREDDLDSHHHSVDRSPTGARFDYTDVPEGDGDGRGLYLASPYTQGSVLGSLPKRPDDASPTAVGSSLTSPDEQLSEATPLVPSLPKHSTCEVSNDFGATSITGRSREITYLAIAWAVNAFCLAMAGGPAALACGPISNRLWLYGLITFQLSFISWTSMRLQTKKRSASDDDVKRFWWWVEGPKMAKYCGLSCLAGVGAGLLGIGGGLIKGPLLISIGLFPINAVATSNYMILFTSSTNVLAFLLAGRLDAKHAPIFASLTLLGGVTGATTLKRAFARSHRQYLLTFVLGCSIVLGGVAMATVNIREIVLRAEGNVHHEQTFAEACDYLNQETHPWQRLRLVEM